MTRGTRGATSQWIRGAANSAWNWTKGAEKTVEKGVNTAYKAAKDEVNKIGDGVKEGFEVVKYTAYAGIAVLILMIILKVRNLARGN